MKILFSADWHIKLGQKSVPIDWQRNRYLMLFDKLNSIKCDLQIVGGDIFDRIPTLEEQELFWNFIYGCKVETLIYSGNHEAVGKYTTFLSYLKTTVTLVNPLVRVVDTIEDNGEFIIIPYNQLKKWVEVYDEKDIESSICFTHVRGEIPPHVTPEINLDLLNRFAVVFAGDLHSHSNTQRNIVYPGSPLTTSFHRNLVSNGCILIDTTEWRWDWIDLELPQLLKLSVTDPEEMVRSDYHHTVYELHGDVMDLSKVAGQDLLDKKVIRSTSESSLLLTKEMSLEDELSEFLLYITGLEEPKVKRLLKVYHDNIKNHVVV